MLCNIWCYHLRWREMLLLTISWCYGSINILWIQSVLGLLGLSVGVPGLLNKIVDFGGPKWHLDSLMFPKFYQFHLVLPLWKLHFKMTLDQPLECFAWSSWREVWAGSQGRRCRRRTLPYQDPSLLSKGNIANMLQHPSNALFLSDSVI